MGWTIGEANRVESTMICDSYIDTLYIDPPGVSVKRLGLGYAFDPQNGFSMPVADNCSAMLVEIYALEDNPIGAAVPYRILFDCGGAPDIFIGNMEKLGIDPKTINHVVISHGHPDHLGSIKAFMDARDNVPCPVLIHPDTFSARYIESPAGYVFPHICGALNSKKECEEAGARFVSVTDPVKVGPGCMTTGNIPWHEDVPFEPSPITIYHDKNYHFELDKTDDEVGLCINLKGKGLVVLSGCAHNGIINTIKRCQEVSGVDEVYAVIGGFHLGFPEVPESMIGKTIEELKKINPKVIIPQHCTGFKATAKIMETFPGQYVQSSVGMKVMLPMPKDDPEQMAQIEAKRAAAAEE